MIGSQERSWPKAAGVTLLLLELASTNAFAQNDTCAAALPMTAGVTYVQNTAPAGNNGVVPSCQVLTGKCVWYKFTPPNSGTFYLSTCGSDFDTILGVYTGTCELLTEMICSDDDGPSCSGFAASLSFSGVAGTTYSILAGGFLGASGQLRIQIMNPSLAGGTWSNGFFHFVVKGPAGSNCVLQASSNLAAWLPIATNPIGAGGTLNFTDTGSTNNPRRFYRAVLP